jgi:hypothetical protein
MALEVASRPANPEKRLNRRSPAVPDTTFRVDLTRTWNDVDGSTSIAFTDLEGRRVSIDIDGYFQLTAIRVSAP